MQIMPNIYLLKVPIPNNLLGFTNSYLIKTEEGSILIDTGWNTEEAFSALSGQLENFAVTWKDIRYIIITHAHPDHMGLIGRLVQHTTAKVVMHELEDALLHERYLDIDSLLVEMGYWLRLNGVPESKRPLLLKSSLSKLGYVSIAKPDLIVQGGEHIQLGNFDLEIIWTPGHSPGHICIYEAKQQILFTGDHILARITPNISMHVQTLSNPLADYLNTFDSLTKLDAEIVLPAHEEIIRNLHVRIEEIKQHHKNRNLEIIQALTDGAKNAYQVASQITWSTGGVNWVDLKEYTQRAAVTETISHLELLFSKGIIRKTNRNGLVFYSK